MSQFVVAIDARPLSNPHPGGFRSYVRALLRGLSERSESGENIPRILLYVDRPLAVEIESALPAGAEVRVLSGGRLRIDCLLWNAQTRHDAPDLVFGTQNYAPFSGNIPTVVALHDAMGIKKYGWDRHTPRTFRERVMNRYWYHQTMRSARAARRIITVSQSAQAEIRSVLTEIPEERFHRIYNGIDFPAPRNAGPRDAGTILCVASPDHRKNLDLLYDSLSNHREMFGNAFPSLRIACTSAKTAARTRDLLDIYGLDAQLLVGSSDQELAEEYARATVFVWPSRLEGFGLPPLEMMTTGGAVASSNAPCMPEVLGDAPVYFEPFDAAGLARAIHGLLQNPAEREERGRLGRQHASSFTCRTMADETVGVWESALQSVRG